MKKQIDPSKRGLINIPSEGIDSFLSKDTQARIIGAIHLFLQDQEQGFTYFVTTEGIEPLQRFIFSDSDTVSVLAVVLYRNNFAQILASYLFSPDHLDDKAAISAAKQVIEAESHRLN